MANKIQELSLPILAEWARYSVAQRQAAYERARLDVIEGCIAAKQTASGTKYPPAYLTNAEKSSLNRRFSYMHQAIIGAKRGILLYFMSQLLFSTKF